MLVEQLLLPPESPPERLAGPSLEQLLEDGQARLGPRERVTRLVADIQTGGELTSRHVAPEREDPELAPEP